MKQSRPAQEDWRNGGFGLYVHWPFCQSLCPYCDFNSYVARSIDHEAWADAFVAEIRWYAAAFPDRVLNSVFFGGGTPSLMEPFVVERIIEAARDGWPIANDIEITLEANPGSSERAKFQAIRSAGVNRVSLGIQAFEEAALRALGRRHSAEDALRAWDDARSVFDRASFDLIYARQDQGAESWQRELEFALSLGPTHLSLYQLTIEENTAFGDRFRAGALRGLPSEDLASDLYELTQLLCNAAGLPAYETSNHAVQGQESIHNLIYWRSGDYVGVGPGAHGRLTTRHARTATVAAKLPEEWLRGVAAGDRRHETSETISPTERAEEYMMMALRLREGADLQRWEILSGAPFPLQKITPLVDLGVLWRQDHRIGSTERGRPLLNAVLNELLC